jgi:hypothetical protein
MGYLVLEEGVKSSPDLSINKEDYDLLEQFRFMNGNTELDICRIIHKTTKQTVDISLDQYEQLFLRKTKCQD